MTQPIDYTLILTKLLADRAKLDAAIASIRTLVPEGGSGSTLQASAAIDGLPSDAFTGMNIAEAAHKYLEQFAKRPQTLREIVDALRQGGLRSTSQASRLRRDEALRGRVPAHAAEGFA